MEGFSYNKRSVLEKYDSAPTANSTNLVPSGGIKTYVDTADATIDAKVDDMISRVGNPFVFKGTVAALTDLPGSGNTVNDTYFVTAEGFMYTWNGSSWDKTSTDVNNQLAHDIATEYDATKADYKAGNIVMYNNQVYVRNADATAAEGTFVAANWTATSIGDELYDEVTNLKSAFIQNVSYITGWERGTIDSSGNDGASTNTTRKRTSGYTNFSDYTPALSVALTIKSGYKVSARAYSDTTGSGSFVQLENPVEWHTGNYTLSTEYYYRFVIAFEDDSKISDHTIPDDALAYTIFSFTDTTFTMPNKAADAKEVGNYIVTLSDSQNLINNTLMPITEPPLSRPRIGTTGYFGKYIGLKDLNVAQHGIRAYLTGYQYFSCGFAIDDIADSGMETGVDYTLSFGFKYKLYSNSAETSEKGIRLYLAEADTNGTLVNPKNISAETSTNYKRIATVTPSGFGQEFETDVVFTFNLLSTTKKFEIIMTCGSAEPNGHSTSDYIELSNIKLQRGNIATAWTPSNYDIVNVYTVTSSNDIISRNDRTETVLKLQQLNRPTRISGSNFGTAPFCLLHFSDIHGDQNCLENIVKYKNEYSDYIDDIIHTGDIVTQYSTDGMDFWNNVNGSETILNVIGNHDTRVGSSWNSLTMAESYSTYFAPYISNWGATYTIDKTYYYKDYTEKKIRLIVLDYMKQNSEQLTWFQSTLSDAITKELHVIVATHSKPHWLFDSYDTPWDDKPVVSLYEDGRVDKSQTSPYPVNLANDYAASVDSFITNGGEFICWIHGHTHYKMFAQLESYPRQLDVAVANAGGRDYAETYVWERVKNTKSEDDFNVLAVDVDSKILRIMKVGVNYDRCMRWVDTISYNYGTRELIYSN